MSKFFWFLIGMVAGFLLFIWAAEVKVERDIHRRLNPPKQVWEI
jgi:hypothetical protein